MTEAAIQPTFTAETVQTAAAGKEQSSYGLFSRSRQTFGLGIEFLAEVIQGHPITRVPKTPSLVAGALNLRGEILPVVLIDSLLGLAPRAYDPAKPIMIIRQAELLLGIQVDSVRSVVNVPPAQVLPKPAETSEAAPVLGLWSYSPTELVTLLDGAKLLNLVRREATPPRRTAEIE